MLNDPVNTFNGSYWNIHNLSSSTGRNSITLAIEVITNQIGTVSNYAKTVNQSANPYKGYSSYNATITVGQTKTTVSPVSGYATQNISLKATVTGSTVNEGKVQFKVGNVTAGTANVKNGVATLNWKVPSSWKPNTYTITAKYLGTGNYLASSGTGKFTLKPFPNITCWQSISKGTHYYGDTIHYYITVENQGPETLGFSVYDKLPSGLKYVSSTANRGSYKSNTWNIGTLKPGQTAKLDIKALIEKVGMFTVTSKITISTWKEASAIDQQLRST